jgi:nitrous oxidase accessory protein NosD
MIDRSHSSESEGKATLTNNAIFSNVLSGVHIVAGSTAKLCKNSIHGNKRHGVTVLGINSQSEAAQLEENEIHSNIFGGVHIKGPGARAVVLSNRIFGNKGGGVIIKAKAKATLERNDILSSSSCNGVSILGGSDAILRSNRIYGSSDSTTGRTLLVSSSSNPSRP